MFDNVNIVLIKLKNMVLDVVNNVIRISRNKFWKGKWPFEIKVFNFWGFSSKTFVAAAFVWQIDNKIVFYFAPRKFRLWYQKKAHILSHYCGGILGPNDVIKKKKEGGGGFPACGDQFTAHCDQRCTIIALWVLSL